MTKHVLVTGFNGFVGTHLVQALIDAGCVISGLTRDEEIPDSLGALMHDTLLCDLSDRAQVDKLDLSPYDAIINLAGLAGVGRSFDEPELYMQVNVGVLTNLCEALLAQNLAPRVIAISSGAVYASDQPMPLREDALLAVDASPYTKSKRAMEAAALGYRERGLPECIVVRPFNHFGPGQKTGFIVPDMYEQIMSALQTSQPLKIGNLTSRRDYTDVRDVVQAYTKLVLAPSNQLHEAIYNVCRGVSRSGEDILAIFRKLIPGAEKLGVEVDPSRIRPNDPPELVGSNDRLIRDTGWQPEIAFEQTIADFVTASGS